jgi:hypothetical protein
MSRPLLAGRPPSQILLARSSPNPRSDHLPCPDRHYDKMSLSLFVVVDAEARQGLVKPRPPRFLPDALAGSVPDKKSPQFPQRLEPQLAPSSLLALRRQCDIDHRAKGIVPLRMQDRR